MNRPRKLPWLSLLLVLFPGCGGAAPEASAVPHESTTLAADKWPTGTVLAVNDMPIAASDVDRLCAAVSKLYPAYSRPHQRRLVLTNLSLDQAAVRSRDHEHWAPARERCSKEWKRLQDGLQPSRKPNTYSGRHAQMGFGIWSHASLQDPGVWQGPYDLIGQWAIIRLDAYDDTTKHLEVSALTFSYLDPLQNFGQTRQESIRAARDAGRLQIIDPEWEEYVPMHWQYDMESKQ